MAEGLFSVVCHHLLKLGPFRSPGGESWGAFGRFTHVATRSGVKRVEED